MKKKKKDRGMETGSRAEEEEEEEEEEEYDCPAKRARNEDSVKGEPGRRRSLCGEQRWRMSWTEYESQLRNSELQRRVQSILLNVRKRSKRSI
ncbi:hypothetical protein EYF80_022418 [Liparis tanakae]|uniref:Uncharacterized protein n=1 Tax=Liparis tanakae TaxID=230148 RepID=A0A4Z2HP19_9TELE|nr:hypothetical protein EYF80_022418 [Liparis tanakae]